MITTFSHKLSIFVEPCCGNLSVPSLDEGVWDSLRLNLIFYSGTSMYSSIWACQESLPFYDWDWQHLPIIVPQLRREVPCTETRR